MLEKKNGGETGSSPEPNGKKRWITPEISILSSNDIHVKPNVFPKEGAPGHTPSANPLSYHS